MKKLVFEIKWGIIFVVILLLWMLLEKSMGLHDVQIDKHANYSNLFALVAIIIFVVALLDKRKNYFTGKMTWLQGFYSGIGITVIVTILTPLAQYITSTFITPDYFSNVIEFTVEQGKMTQKEAEEYFNLQSYIVQSSIGSFVMGVVTSAIVALFVKKK